MERGLISKKPRGFFAKTQGRAGTVAVLAKWRPAVGPVHGGAVDRGGASGVHRSMVDRGEVRGRRGPGPVDRACGRQSRGPWWTARGQASGGAASGRPVRGGAPWPAAASLLRRRCGARPAEPRVLAGSARRGGSRALLTLANGRRRRGVDGGGAGSASSAAARVSRLGFRGACGRPRGALNRLGWSRGSRSTRGTEAEKEAARRLRTPSESDGG
jgi:hypothetical protein